MHRRIGRWLADMPPEVWVSIAAAALVVALAVLAARMDWCIC